MKVSKSNVVRNLLQTQPNMSASDMAKKAGCDVALVYQLRKELPLLAKVTMGRPRKDRQISLVEASNVLQYLVKDIKDLCISFDHSRNKLDVLWHEELFQVAIDELPKTIDSIKFLARKEATYDEVDHHDNA
jgi:hypothetical protein